MQVPLERVKRIEIVRGGRGSVLYGDNAGAGVINIITGQGDSPSADVEFSGGSYKTFRSSAQVGGSGPTLRYATSEAISAATVTGAIANPRAETLEAAWV